MCLFLKIAMPCRVLTAQDCALILGFPGTGKTSTIAAAIMALLHLGKSVLVSAYTNSAVDTILAKLAALGAPILRIGRAETIHPAVKDYTLGSARYPDISAGRAEEDCARSCAGSFLLLLFFCSRSWRMYSCGFQAQWQMSEASANAM